jgi:hypothetical protein
VSGELSKTIATGFVWASVAAILVFGAYRIDGGTGLFYLVVTLIVMVGAVVASVVIWSPGAFLGDKATATRGFEVIQPAEKLDRE